MVQFFGSGSLAVLKGQMKDGDPVNFVLSKSNPPQIFLLEENLIEIKIKGQSKDLPAPVLILRRDQNEIQSFQMIPEGDLDHTFSVSFSVRESADLFVSSVSASRKLASVNLKKVPAPVVVLSAGGQPSDLWPDDQQLGLKIRVNSNAPIDRVDLEILVGKAKHKEKVVEVVGSEKNELTLDYKIGFDTYVEDDVAEVEIVAIATDRSLPSPLRGFSEPLRFRVASAYGRYREALQTLNQMREELAESISNQTLQLSEKMKEAMRRLEKQSSVSPFFDGYDRLQLLKMVQELEEVDAASDMNSSEKMSRLLDVQSDMEQFLMDHESLNDRERDRDFFVAVRTIAKIVDIEKEKVSEKVLSVTKKISNFLDERMKRWDLRVQKLPKELIPSMWNEVKNGRIFYKAMTEIDQHERIVDRGKRLKQKAILANVASEYRKWIEELEEREAKAKEKAEQDRQKGMVSMREEIKELQKRQGEISSALDAASEQTFESMKQKWSNARVNQSTNVAGAKSLEGKLRSQSTQASQRMKAAVEAMEQTIEKGNAEQFAEAESFSDLAGRLLRQADQATSQSQSRQTNQQRRRRIGGDNYFGKSVAGDDIEIKQSYQVGAEFREEILDDVDFQGLSNDDREVVESYLRDIVR